MSRIHLLDQEVAELIAAGEVVERPASIVKELMENSIDAGATQITVEIKGGGVGYIRITDNGEGIHKEDIPHAFLRHATSKVSSAADLEVIGTLGFRGEALSSVAAVSKVEVITKTAESLDGWFYEIQGGSALEIPTPVGAPDGTTFIIRDVFYNTPARMKFLRTDVAEGNAVAQVVDKIALSHPEVAVHFIRDTKTRLQTSGTGDLKTVISSIYGRDFAASLLPVEYTFEHIHIKGYIGQPSYSKPSRTYQNFFINGRYVRTRTCSVALEEAFKGKLLSGHFPVCVLSLDLEPSQVDANVHPAKIEVRFSQEKSIYNSVYFGVKNALKSTETPLRGSPKQEEMNPLSLDLPEQEVTQQRLTASETPSSFPRNEPKKSEDFPLHKKLVLSSPTAVAPSGVYQNPAEYAKFISATSDTIVSEERKKDPITSPAALKEEYKPLGYVGELFATYILLESGGDELVLVDKHAAHERLIYETLKKNIREGNRQVLLTGEPITLQKDEYTAILENLDILETLGFLVEDFGTGTLIVRESPGELDGKDLGYLLSEIAEKILTSRRDLTPQALDELYFSIACRTSVHGGDKNHQEELMEIIRLLEENPEITHCPHGRPLAVRITRHQLEKMFGRLG